MKLAFPTGQIFFNFLFIFCTDINLEENHIESYTIFLQIFGKKNENDKSLQFNKFIKPQDSFLKIYNFIENDNFKISDEMFKALYHFIETYKKNPQNSSAIVRKILVALFMKKLADFCKPHEDLYYYADKLYCFDTRLLLLTFFKETDSYYHISLFLSISIDNFLLKYTNTIQEFKILDKSINVTVNLKNYRMLFTYLMFQTCLFLKTIDFNGYIGNNKNFYFGIENFRENPDFLDNFSKMFKKIKNLQIFECSTPSDLKQKGLILDEPYNLQDIFVLEKNQKIVIHKFINCDYSHKSVNAGLLIYIDFLKLCLTKERHLTLNLSVDCESIIFDYIELLNEKRIISKNDNDFMRHIITIFQDRANIPIEQCSQFDFNFENIFEVLKDLIEKYCVEKDLEPNKQSFKLHIDKIESLEEQMHIFESRCAIVFVENDPCCKFILKHKKVPFNLLKAHLNNFFKNFLNFIKRTEIYCNEKKDEKKDEIQDEKQDEKQDEIQEKKKKKKRNRNRNRKKKNKEEEEQ
ncbi:hypothetical protein GVAV_001629 [Gurleya vavrai]